MTVKIIDLRKLAPNACAAKPATEDVAPRAHDRCPSCGNLNGPFERLGSGICNECLTKRANRSRAQQARRRRERGERDDDAR